MLHAQSFLAGRALRAAALSLLLTLMFAPLTRAQDAQPTPFIFGSSASLNAALSADGRVVAFASDASNLVADDTNDITDVFVHDRQSGETTRVSVASDGAEGDDYSSAPALSADGRFVAFESEAGNLVEGDSNFGSDIFVHDRETGETTRVSVATDGAEGSQASLAPSISGDGRYVAFWSNAANLVAEDLNGMRDAFVHDRESGVTTRVSLASGGKEANNDTFDTVISADGQVVAFWSHASNLVPGDSNEAPDVFVRDLAAGETTRVNRSSEGAQADNYTFEHISLSADGRYVAFQSQAGSMVADDDDNLNDVFVHDRQSGETTRVSAAQGLCVAFCLGASEPALSADGRYVVFTSDVDNLVADDRNATWDVFVHDRETGETARVSLNASGEELDTLSGSGVISADGRWVAFETSAALVFGDFNFTTDVYLHDRDTGAAALASLAPQR